MQQKSFYDEQNEIFVNFLNNFAFKQLAKEKNNGLGLELILTPDCNKNCVYCYLQKHKDEMYPVETRNLANIKNNLRILLDYFLENNVILSKVDLYSGEIWESSFSLEIFEILLQYIEQGIGIKNIIIPTNGSFIQNDTAVKNIEYYIEKFKINNVNLVFSLSYDGILDKENRPLNNSLKDNEFDDDKIFNFALKHDYGFHPMVSAIGIEKWVENHNYWKEKIKKFNKTLARTVMFLEVRDGDTWTDEAIENYLKWLQIFAKDTIEEDFGTNYFDALEHIMRLNHDDKHYSYTPYFQHLNHNEISCSLTQQLVIRLGDLSIVPCHRLCYDKFIYGKFIVENNKIINIEAKNPNFMYTNLLSGSNGYLKCDTCPFARYCIKQCHGACFEYSKESLYPIPDVCNLEITKILFQLNLLMDLKEKVKNDDMTSQMALGLKKAEQFLNDIKNNRKEYSKWVELAEKYRIKF